MKKAEANKKVGSFSCFFLVNFVFHFQIREILEQNS